MVESFCQREQGKSLNIFVIKKIGIEIEETHCGIGAATLRVLGDAIHYHFNQQVGIFLADMSSITQSILEGCDKEIYEEAEAVIGMAVLEFFTDEEFWPIPKQNCDLLYHCAAGVQLVPCQIERLIQSPHQFC